MTRLRYRSAPRTHVGLVRQVNEDSLLARDEAALWVVADGMGGHDNGQWASRTLVAQFAELDMAGDPRARGGAMVDALERGNRAIHDAAAAVGRQMGTTAVLAHGEGEDVLLLWVGDSRAYRLRGGRLEQLTRDHTVVQELVDRGALAPHEAESHPMSHVLSRAVGTEAEVRYEAVTDRAAPGDRYLLCSDGLTKVVGDAEVAQLLGQGGIEAAADRLIERTLAAGAPDNTSLVILSVEEITILSFGAAQRPAGDVAPAGSRLRGRGHIIGRHDLG